MARPPVILQVLPELGSGGVERGTIDIARAVIGASGKALVASSGGRLVDTLTSHGATHITLPLNSKNPWRMWRNIHALETAICETRADLVHVRSRAPAWSAYYAAQRAGVPLVTTFHGTYGLSGPGKRFYNSVMVKGERVIAVSSFIAAHIKEHYDVSSEAVRVIHRGVDTDYFNPETVRHDIVQSLREDWLLPDDETPIFFMPGRYTRWKGQHVVLEAVAALPDKDIICVFAGDASKHPRYTTELYEKAEHLGIADRVRFVAPTSHMPEAYSLSHIVLCPSLEPEAFGRVAVEASAMGRPVIAAAHGGARETVIHGQTGWLVTPGDRLAYCDVLMQVLQQSTYDQLALAEKARQHVIEHFSLQVMQEKTLDIYEEVIQRHAARRTTNR